MKFHFLFFTTKNTNKISEITINKSGKKLPVINIKGNKVNVLDIEVLGITDFDDSNKDEFLNSIKKYIDINPKDIWPDFCGIRPKLQAKGMPFEDFYIKNEVNYGLKNFINLLGIDSPGLTSSLAIAEYVDTIIV